jgi:outer membrane lipoprotein SlyB
MRTIRLASMAGGGALAALLAACGSTPSPSASSSPPPTASMQKAPARVEYGRVTRIEPIAGGTATRSGPSVPGAIIGAVAGGVVGSQVGSGSGQTAATVLGAAGGAAVGSQVGRTTTMPQPMYRVTVQTEGGVTRYYDVPATNDLRVGDSVQIEHAVIYRT